MRRSGLKLPLLNVALLLGTASLIMFRPQFSLITGLLALAVFVSANLFMHKKAAKLNREAVIEYGLIAIMVTILLIGFVRR